MTMLSRVAARNALQRFRVAADAEIRRVDHRVAAELREATEFATAARSTSSRKQLSRLTKGFIRSSPMNPDADRSLGEGHLGRFGRDTASSFEASSRMCSCISVTPMRSAGIGPSTVMTVPL